MTPPPPRWLDALRAAELLAVDPAGLGGALLLGGPGPLRDAWLAHFRAHLPAGAPFRRLPAGTGDDRLLGAVDLPASLAQGRPVLQRGLLAEADGGALVIPMAERLDPAVAARIKAALDQGEVLLEREGLTRRLATRLAVIACDEGLGDDEAVPRLLAQRLAFVIDLDAMTVLPPAAAAQPASGNLAAVAAPDPELLAALVAIAARCGLDGMTAPLLALRAARAAAARRGGHAIDEDDVTLAVRLVLSPRARQAPEAEPPADGPAEPPPPGEPAEGPPSAEAPPLEDLLLAAAQAALPAGLLQPGAADQRRPASRRSGGGGRQQAPTRGRPAGVRAGELRPGAKLALVETLRAAAPWQAVRRRQLAAGDGPLIEVRRDDFRLKKFQQRREATIVFCVDASGSAAFHRLAESKGAVELLLQDAYVSRTHAALVSFRGSGAELLLPPTRSLSRAKALLGHLPGGGGTPLAAGIDLAFAVASAEQAKGREALVVMLTDGRANIGRDGRPARPGAGEDALAAARRFALNRIRAVLIDTAPRPRPEAAALAAAMAARYVALPYVDAAAMRAVARDFDPAGRRP